MRRAAFEDTNSSESAFRKVTIELVQGKFISRKVAIEKITREFTIRKVPVEPI